MKPTLTAHVGTALLATAIAGMLGASPAASSVESAKPIVTIVRHGGMPCYDGKGGGTACSPVFRIGDATISAPGFVPRRLKPSERVVLLRAIERLNLRYLRDHPFTGTCPMAYDAPESIYRFRGFAPKLASCTYDLRGVEAVRLTERLLASLRHR